ncbi:MAG: cysteine desulfurase [Chitinophagales bacterium]|nr:cysteine desulfurase [Chitinophagales bacterium]
MLMIYFDSAATTQLDERVLDAMLPYLREQYGNPSSIHSMGRQVRAAIEKARKTVATHLKASIGEIYFTSGGTESNNMALSGAVRDLGVRHIITSPLEHHCVLHRAESLHRFRNVSLHYVEHQPDGHINLDHLDRLLTETRHSAPRIVSLMHGNNEIGNLLDLAQVADICQSQQAYFHTDTVQTFGYYPIDVQKIPIHFLSGSAHKFHGPKGVGFVYVNSRSPINPYLWGGAQERNMRAGTENVSGIVGLGKAIEIAYTDLDKNRTAISELKNYFITRLRTLLPAVQFNGDLAQGAYKVLNVSFPPNAHNDLLLFNLDIVGICASGGSACSSGADAGSHVLNALGVAPDRANVRFSFSKYNTRDEIDATLDKLANILKWTVTR